ncbi:4'-phosphopantetheinyl transferase family protein [Streptomyces sp. Da 82-17]|uniref:4'-phosphopantetheinyl transferase family protein n=1 Tax=Streptomyces sp. Da 82-17 TaxID=3377116 RepID=UPI0038D442CE
MTARTSPHAPARTSPTPPRSSRTAPPTAARTTTLAAPRPAGRTVPLPSPLVTQVAPDVWVARGGRRRWAAVAPHPLDRESADGLPPWRAAEFLASRALLRALLATTLPALADAPVTADADGRPVLDGHPDTGISISHDGEAVAVAVAPHRTVGVDVQLPQDRAPESLLRRCLGGHADAVLHLPERQRAAELAWVWTAQEACVKAAGTGLAGRPWQIDVPPHQLLGRWGEFTWVSLRGRSRTPLSCAFTATRPRDLHLPVRGAALEAPCP